MTSALPGQGPYVAASPGSSAPETSRELTSSSVAAQCRAMSGTLPAELGSRTGRA